MAHDHETEVGVGLTMRLHLHLHVDGPVHVVHHQGVDWPGPATQFSLKLLTGGHTMGSTEFSVDATNPAIVPSFKDDKGDVVPAPAGAAIAYTSSDETIATIANDATDPLQGDLTILQAGQITVDAAVSGVTEADGTPFPDAQVTLTLDPGAATQVTITSNQ
jgi:hypothetical protein